MAGEAPVLYEQEGGVVTITLNRPEKMNNFGGGLFPALGDAFVRFRDDDRALVAILTGRGKAFCAGGDLEGMAERSRTGAPPAEPAPERQRQSFFQSRKATRITNIYKPLIGAINGYCFAGGLEVALCCHFLIGAESSEYGVLNRRFSVPLIDGGTYRLPRVVGLSNALYLIQTGRRIDAREAHRMGLIQEVVPDGQLMARARELAGILAAVPRAGLRGDTESVLRGLGRPIEDALALESIIGGTVLASEDFRRGPARFAAKTYDPVTG
jgi:enoyl-CoA hydratase